MKKYFMKGTEDQLEFGEMIVVDLTREDDDKTIHHHLDCKFIPQLVPLLLENDVIEEREVDGEEEFEDSQDDVIKGILKHLDRQDKQIETVAKICDSILKRLDREEKKEA